jgi:hypothetical protein
MIAAANPMRTRTKRRQKIFTPTPVLPKLGRCVLIQLYTTTRYMVAAIMRGAGFMLGGVKRRSHMRITTMTAMMAAIP